MACYYGTLVANMLKKGNKKLSLCVSLHIITCCLTSTDQQYHEHLGTLTTCGKLFGTLFAHMLKKSATNNCLSVFLYTWLPVVWLQQSRKTTRIYLHWQLLACYFGTLAAHMLKKRATQNCLYVLLYTWLRVVWPQQSRKTTRICLL